MDTPPIKSLLAWLDAEAGAKTAPSGTHMERTMSELSDLKRRIAAGEYRLDASAIAEAMFGAADRALAAERSSEVLEPGQCDSAPGGVDEL